MPASKAIRMAALCSGFSVHKRLQEGKIAVQHTSKRILIKVSAGVSEARLSFRIASRKST